MISIKEFLGNYTMADLPFEHERNAYELLKKVNILREEYGHPWLVTSGYRSMQDQIRIYSEKGIPREKIPLKSKHLIGAAIDIYDPDLQITKWLKENDSRRLREVVLYCEEGNKNWVHFQLYPPGSGKIWFYP